ncbi:DUF4349 domain-containing protein [Streptomyces sp. JB150]|uniref:DUF4349 domain-containing protein n=1 Tax=Streptomyces sp. JB150 TaxID=2714844 RepID=UPI00140D6A47|nr:DUF4349 domain-containing protein [Streptomyces sp. JB150]QIJ65293.1 DUF4349 domain-containing protein [Streptomyces sp. JB150]
MRTRHSARRPVRYLAGLLLATALAATGCSGEGDASGAADKGAKAADAGAGYAEGSSGSRSRTAQDKAPKPAASHIIRTASLTVQVKDVPRALAETRAIAEGAGGHVGRETTHRNDDEEYTELVLRVPVDRYEEVLEDLEGTGRLLERTAKAQDVTEQVVDVESRIRTQRASVERIRALMEEATKLGDVVTLEGELSSRQADLESLLARQASLKDRTSLATITVSLNETPAVQDAADDDPGVADALGGGWAAFLGMLRWIVVALAAVLPFAALAALLVLAWLRLVRPRRAHRAAEPAAVTALGPLPAHGRGPGWTDEPGRSGEETPASAISEETRRAEQEGPRD